MKKRICVSFLLVLALCLSLAPTALAEEEPWVEASGAIILDHDTGEVYFEKNADVARPVASMTKVMSVYLVFEEIAAGRLSLDSRVTASSRAADLSNNPEYSGLERLRAGGSYPVDTLLRLIMTSSCNGAVLVLAEHIGGGSEAVFVERMNAKAEEMGIDAHYADCCGIADDGNAVTPRAMALLARRIIEDYPQILEYSSLKSTYFDDRTFKSSNLLLLDDRVEGIDGLKTGTTTKAGFCFTATAKRNGQRIIAVVMNAASREDVMSGSQTLLEYGFACRAERETVWSAEEKRVRLTVSASTGDKLYSNGPARLTATVSGISDGVYIPCLVQWTVNGAAVEAKGTGVVRNGEAASSISYTAPAGNEQLDIRCTVTMPYGTTAEGRLVLPVSEEKITFTGQLGVQQAELYPEDILTIPCQIACDQGLELTVSAGWYMDGVPIPGFQNDAFRLSPQRTSQYTVSGSVLTPGKHLLEFYCNTAGLPGVDQAVLRCEILALSAEQAA